MDTETSTDRLTRGSVASETRKTLLVVRVSRVTQSLAQTPIRDSQLVVYGRVAAKGATQQHETDGKEWQGSSSTDDAFDVSASKRPCRQQVRDERIS